MLQALGADDFGVSCEELAAFQVAMARATEDAREHPSDAWDTVMQGLRAMRIAWKTLPQKKML